MKVLLKKTISRSLVIAGIDRLGRWRNRQRLLTVMYHGITRHKFVPSVWTQLPEKIFLNQIEFLASHYKPVTLKQVLDAIHGDAPLPQRAVLITFDDGLRNNATVAWPILKHFGVPASIFLTVDFIGSPRFFWVDELYLYLVEASRQNISLCLDDWPLAANLFRQSDIWGAYFDIVESCKRLSQKSREEHLTRMASMVKFDRETWAEDFGLMDWQQVQQMDKEGLIDFGVHTATHQILTGMEPIQVEQELVRARQTLEEKLGRSTTAFCYPNGRRGIDFTEKHEKLLQKLGYCCAFATDRGLFNPGVDNPFAIKRIPAGHDLTSTPTWFRLNAAGLCGV